MSNRLNLIFCCVRAKLLGYRLICMFGFNQRAVHSHMALFVLDLGNDLDFLNAAVIKAEHLKCVHHHCSSIGKCSIEKRAGRKRPVTATFSPHYSLSTSRCWVCLRDFVLQALSKAQKPVLSQRMSQRNKAHRPIRETGNRSIYLYRHQNAVSWACWQIPPMAQQMGKGQACRCLLWLLWWGWRWNVWRQSRCK